MSHSHPAPRATRLVVALPTLTKTEASLLATVLSMAVRELRGDDYRPILDFTGDDETVDVLLVDFALERGPPTRRGTPA
jgi:hypothetical protein